MKKKESSKFENVDEPVLEQYLRDNPINEKGKIPSHLLIHMSKSTFNDWFCKEKKNEKN